MTSWTWAGPYLGLNAGYGFGKSNTDTVIGDATVGTLVATSTSSKLDGMIFGAQAGFNWQSGPWVAGIEVDIQSSQTAGADDDIRLRRRDLQLRARSFRVRCACERENGTEAGMVRDAAGTPRRHADARNPWSTRPAVSQSAGSRPPAPSAAPQPQRASSTTSPSMSTPTVIQSK